MKIYVVGGATNYTNFLEPVKLVNKVEDAQIVMFTGGEDVSPSLYGCKKHYSTYSNYKRDLEEKAVFEKVRSDQLCIGCCRGSQFLCTMNGGLLIQDVSGHASRFTHAITNGDSLYQITSTHHQMQYPYNLDKEDYDLLYWAYPRISDYYEGDQISQYVMYDHHEPEIVLYHKKGFPKCLAIQGHPEMIPNSPVAKMIKDLIKGLVNEDK